MSNIFNSRSRKNSENSKENVMRRNREAASNLAAPKGESWQAADARRIDLAKRSVSRK